MGLTMSDADEREDRFAAQDKSGSGTCDPYRLECAWREIDALRERVKTLEGALGRLVVACDEHVASDPEAQYRYQCKWPECNEARELIAAIAPLKEADRG